MDSTTNNEETTRPAMIINLATRNANPDEEHEYAEEPGLDGDFRPDGDEDEDFPYGDDVEFTHPDFSE
jgi:hypothetical protein